jgi:hypothetical protein
MSSIEQTLIVDRTNGIPNFSVALAPNISPSAILHAGNASGRDRQGHRHFLAGHPRLQIATYRSGRRRRKRLRCRVSRWI